MRSSFTPDDVAFGDCLDDAFAASVSASSDQFVDAEESFGTMFDDCLEDAFELGSELESFYECDETL